MSLLSVRDLTVTVGGTPDGTPILQNVSFDVEPGRIVGMVGESGSGKSMTSLAVMGLLPHTVGVTSGRVDLDGRTVLADGRHHGSAGVAMVFQNPRAALNPTMRIGRQIARAVQLGTGGSRQEARAQVAELLKMVEIHDVERVVRAYPHQLSGGMCQRIVIAMALGIKPKLLIADEPTTGLDVTVQAQILTLLRDVADAAGCSVLLITHDLPVVATVCDSMVVLYHGQVRERGTTVDVFENPTDDYTRQLISTLTEEL